MVLDQKVLDKYLYSINPIAKRIGKDVEATKEAYQTFWDGLSYEEQSKILEESIISPETALKYSKYQKLKENKSDGNFSWFTRSQLDLCKHVNSVKEHFFANECKNIIVKRAEKEQQDNKLINKIKSNVLFKSLVASEEKIKPIKTDRTKPKGPPPPPPLPSNTNGENAPIIPSYDHNDDDDENIPKTGFDFLDNW
ncbi:uncharacterized protein LOC126894470 [Daktulosphaira vitifoliae]|uniref:uncharacterized protein LOC126894470 n=1 Tax=Daktulosphaira vitifoliae TaxID=58002 RepID=UPI0021AAF82A|nr:uncharacterized protein LOC126894470 [Daktulosphaira vitifoliae]